MSFRPLVVAAALVLLAAGCTQPTGDSEARPADGQAVQAVQETSAGEGPSGQGVVPGEPWSRAVPPSAPVAAGYISLSNGSADDDRLLAVRTDAAERVEIHEMSHGGDGTMQMRELADGLPLPAGQTVDLRPGGLHLMFFGPDTSEWREGRSIPATLVFEGAGEIEVSFGVYAPGEGPAEPPRIDGQEGGHEGQSGGNEDHDAEHEPHH